MNVKHSFVKGDLYKEYILYDAFHKMFKNRQRCKDWARVGERLLGWLVVLYSLIWWCSHCSHCDNSLSCSCRIYVVVSSYFFLQTRFLKITGYISHYSSSLPPWPSRLPHKGCRTFLKLKKKLWVHSRCIYLGGTYFNIGIQCTIITSG